MTKSALVTGAAGLIGSHLVETLAASGSTVVPTYHRPTMNIAELERQFEMIHLDVTEFHDVKAIIAERRPHEIYHLAAQSLPTESWTDPWGTFKANVDGTVNVFEAIKAIRQNDSSYDPIVVVACSSAEYGASMTPERVPVDEEAPLLPLHPYGVSKVAQDLLAFQYWAGFGIRSIRARIFNCSGPRKRNDVVSDFGARVARVSKHGGVMRVGNLETRRAIIDVRDLVAALMLLAKKGHPGEAYNICSPQVVRVSEILETYMEIAGAEIAYEVDPALLRPTDETIILGSTKKLTEHTGWRPTRTLRETLADVFDYEARNL
ncbi:GDP-mannose 4,6-dehydratase [Methylosinus sp. Ce-a6]|uniref:GDP-mannose 4,6-dehydratase n=1 Tax=Methylosinus sp. Ce-a6 TaxID=2172005 RepID=UPI00135C699F|nr:GDP-mannose 4,6-dehydratase [Methylosinus sp. Ce-a6]